MDGEEPDEWSAIAEPWAELWGGLGAPAWAAVAAVTGIGPGVRVLDVGCGTGDFLAYAHAQGAVVAGVDPAPGMIAYARRRVPAADLRLGELPALPWAGGRFDVVTAFNALQFAADRVAGLVEMARVARAGGFVAVANWAESVRNDLHRVEEAIARAAGEEPLPDDETRVPGGLEWLFEAAGLTLVAVGLVETPWCAPDEEALVRGVLLGEDREAIAAQRSTVVTAAGPFRLPSGGYRFRNAFRYAVGRTAG